MIYLVLYILSMFTQEPAHDFHVSRLTLDYQEDERQFEVTLHVFTDDLELALQERGAPNPKLNTENEWEGADLSIKSYLSDILQLQSITGTKATFQYLGKESSDDFMATWIYFYWKLPEDQNQFVLQHRLLHEIYDDQQNILRIKGCEPEGLKLLTAQDTEVEVNCEK